MKLLAWFWLIVGYDDLPSSSFMIIYDVHKWERNVNNDKTLGSFLYGTA